MQNKYVLVTENSESKPYSSYESAKAMAEAWIGQFSIFQRIEIFKNGKLMETVTPY